MLGKRTRIDLLIFLIVASSFSLGSIPVASVNDSSTPEYTKGSGGFLVDPTTGGSSTGSALYMVNDWNANLAEPHGIEIVSDYQARAPIYIGSDAGFTAPNGVTGGSGTFSDPYLIEGWSINASKTNGIEIRNTNAYFIIRNVQVHSGGLNFNGIFLGSANNAVIQDVVVYSNYRGVFVWLSSHVTMWGGKSYSNAREGISFLSSSYGAIASLNISANGRDGIRVFSSNLVTLAGNNVSSNVGNGLALYDSYNVTVTVNHVIGNGQTGVSLSAAPDNAVYHNNIWGNGEDASDDLSLENVWDAGYPAGGNYWLSYSGQDTCSGASQSSCTGPDGIGDTPYVIDPDSQDQYPLMAPYSDLSPPTWSLGAYVAAANVGMTTVTLTWTQATDNVMVLGYRVYQGGILKVTLPSTLQSYTVSGLTPETTYIFRIEAGDEVSSWSQNGPMVEVTTSSTTGGGGGGRFFLI